jgi:hypothetical protein
MLFLFSLFTIINANVLTNDNFSMTFIHNKMFLNVNDNYDYTTIKYKNLVNNDNIKKIDFNYIEYDEYKNTTLVRTFMSSTECTLDVMNENHMETDDIPYEKNKLYVSFHITKCKFMTYNHELVVEMSINKLFKFDGVNNINTNDFHIHFPLNVLIDYKPTTIKITQTGDSIKLHFPYFSMFADYTFKISYFDNKNTSSNSFTHFSIFIISILIVIFFYCPFFN